MIQISSHAYLVKSMRQPQPCLPEVNEIGFFKKKKKDFFVNEQYE